MYIENKLIPYGYRQRVSKIVGKSEVTLSAVNNGKNKNPILIALVKEAVEKLIAEDLATAKEELNN